jgi:hypothetical protein
MECHTDGDGCIDEKDKLCHMLKHTLKDVALGQTAWGSRRRSAPPVSAAKAQPKLDLTYQDWSFIVHAYISSQVSVGATAAKYEFFCSATSDS